MKVITKDCLMRWKDGKEHFIFLFFHRMRIGGKHCIPLCHGFVGSSLVDMCLFTSLGTDVVLRKGFLFER